MRWMNRLSPVIALAVMGASTAHADNVQFNANDVQTVFFIDKSDDSNRVDYGIRLDEHCQPRGDSPIVVYWREFEDGKQGRVTHGLNIMEGPVYGVRSGVLLARDENTATYKIEIHALSNRAITIHTSRNGARCEAIAKTRVRGEEATLVSVHVTLGDGLGSVRHIDLIGRGSNGQRIRERIRR